MAQTTITYLTDDLNGGDADETVRFSLDGKCYEIDLTKANASALRRTFRRYVKASRKAGSQSAVSRSKPASSATQFSRLNDDEKARFRKWAKLPNARRIADTRVKEWISEGKP